MGWVYKQMDWILLMNAFNTVSSLQYFNDLYNRLKYNIYFEEDVLEDNENCIKDWYKQL